MLIDLSRTATRVRKKVLARWTADRAVGIRQDRQRFGWEAVKYGAAVALERSAPDEFRQLAEKKI